MDAAPRYLWSTVCAWSLTISVVVLGVAGAVAMFTPDDQLAGFSREQWCVIAFAAMAALSIACANNAAAAAMHAISRPNWHWPTLIPALVCSIGFAVASNQAVHLGWGVLAEIAAHPDRLPSAEHVDLAALFLCFAKPAMTWIIEGRKAMDAADRAAAEAAEAATLAAIRKSERSTRPADRPVSQPFQPVVVEGGRPANQISQSVAGVAAISAGVAGAMADRPAEAATFQPPALEQISHSEQTWPSREAHAAALLKQGKSQRAVVRETGLTRYKVGQIAASKEAA